VNNLLEVTRLEASELTINHMRTDLARFAHEVAAHFDGLAQERSISYVIDVPQSLQAEVDPDKVQSVLLNLLSNAFKVTPTGGRIRFSLVASDEQRAVLEVASDHSLVPGGGKASDIVSAG
jgi:signal transduction histidine kinase